MKYKALSHLNHNNIEYGISDVVEMDEKQAKGLVEDGILEKTKESPDKKLTELGNMAIEELKAMAEKKEIDTKRMKKKDLIKALIEAEK